MAPLPTFSRRLQKQRGKAIAIRRAWTQIARRRVVNKVLKPDYSFRPNPGRAVYLTSQFTEEFAAQVIPRIIDLRASKEPITVYINSRGGNLQVLDTIAGALKSRDADGRTSRVIMVALGEAASAAATLLVVGHYAIAHPYSTIHFHGARFPEINVMTLEDTAEYASELSRLNRKNANLMSRRIIGRLVRRYVQLLPKISGRGDKRPSLLDFVTAVKERSSITADKVIDRTIARIRNASDTYDKIYKRAKRAIETKRSAIQQEVAVLKALIDWEVKCNEDVADYCLDQEEIARIASLYSLVRDYQIGEHFRSFATIIRSQGPALLSKEEAEEFAKLDRKDTPMVLDWLFLRTGGTLRSLWHFSVLIARELQSGENRFSARDAYWLGCIDEVLGTRDMLGERADAEIEIQATSP